MTLQNKSERWVLLPTQGTSKMDIEALAKFYENEGEEELRLTPDSAQYLEFLTVTKYLNLCLPQHATILDPCAGSGVYSFYLSEKEHEVTAGDIVPHNVESIRRLQDGKEASGEKLKEIYEGDICNLSRFADESFDAVLCMGALYHISTAAERERAVAESLRVLKPGGLFVGTYMNRHAVILGDAQGSLDNIDDILHFAREGTEGIFYASTPEEMNALMEKFHITKRYHIALDGMAYFMYQTAGLLNETGFKRWQQYHFQICETESLLGLSYHGMFLGEKASLPVLPPIDCIPVRHL